MSRTDADGAVVADEAFQQWAWSASHCSASAARAARVQPDRRAPPNRQRSTRLSL